MGNEVDDRRAEIAFAATLVIGIVVTALLFTAFPEIMVLLLVSGLLSYALLPLVDILTRGLPRWLSILVVAFGGAGLVTLIVLIFAPMIAEQVASLPQMADRITDLVTRAWAWLEARLPRTVSRLLERTYASAVSALRAGKGADPKTVGTISTAVATAITAVASGIVFVPIFVVLMLRGYHGLVARLRKMVPPRWRPRFFARATEADLVLSGFVRGQLLVAAILAVLYGVSFTIIGVPLGAVIGVLAGFGELVPFLGGFIALVFGSLLSVAGGKPIDALWVAVTYFAFQALQSGIISPIVVGSKVKLGPAAVIIAVLVGAQMFGFMGMLLSVPAAGLLKVAARAAAQAYRDSPFFRRNAPV